MLLNLGVDVIACSARFWSTETFLWLDYFNRDLER